MIKKPRNTVYPQTLANPETYKTNKRMIDAPQRENKLVSKLL